MAVVSLPILRLPQSALKNALRQMNLVEHLFLSVLSTKTKQHITMLNEVEQVVLIYMTPSMISMCIESKSIYFDIILEFDHRFCGFIQRHTPNLEITSLSLHKFTAKQWIDQIACVFFKNAVVALTCSKRSIKKLYYYIQDVRIFILEDFDGIQNLPLSKLFPSLKSLIFRRSTKRESILIQNFEEFRFSKSKLTLDRILLSNCSTITITNQVIPDKDFNLFIKHWINGSNRQLKLFNYGAQRIRFVETRLFEGIGYKEVGEYHNWAQFEIESNDGTKATVSFNKSDDTLLVMFVSPLVLSDLPIFKNAIET